MSAVGANLSQAPINLEAHKQAIANDLTRILDKFKGKKALCLDPALAGPLGIVSSVKLMRHHGVTDFFVLTPEAMTTTASSVIYLIRPTISNARTIVDHIQAHHRNPARQQLQFGIYCVTRCTEPVKRILEDLIGIADVETGEFAMDLIPFERDTLTMEVGTSFKECFVDGDPSSLLDVARALLALQTKVGIIPLVKGKGNAAHRVFQLMHRMRTEANQNLFAFTIPEIDQLVLIDRTADLVTPCMTQFTYEGLLDEVFGIKNAALEVDADLVNPTQAGDAPTPTASSSGKEAESKTKTMKKIQLNSSDPLFDEIRDVGFRSLGQILHKKAEFIKDTYALRHEQQTVQELQVFLKKFKTANQEHTFLQIHINLADKVNQVCNHV